MTPPFDRTAPSTDGGNPPARPLVAGYRPARRRRFGAAGVVATVLASLATAVTVGVTAGPAAAKTPEVVAVPASGSVPLHTRGNGHGHGMSQYGAQGAALAGLSMQRILSFYYPGTTLTQLAPSIIRVDISEAGRYTRIVAGPSGLTVTGVSGTLPTRGYSYYRLVPEGAGLELQRLASAAGSHWQVAARNLPARAYFRSRRHYIKLAWADGTFTNYLGSTGAVRDGSGELTINRVSLDDYTAGVVPREMPSSWQPAAVQAQAVAARTYARNAMASGGGGRYDICDTTDCQVYGGHAHFDSNMNLLWTDDPAALSGDQNDVLTYDGAPIFAQFSASDGGATVYGGEPYLPAQTDPYDTTTSGDPYLNTASSASVAGLDDFYGLARVTSIEISRRDGFGPWGGRVVSAEVDGVTPSGSSTQVSTTGDDLADALGIGTTYFHFDNTQAPPGSPSTVVLRPGNAGAVLSWHAPRPRKGAGAIRSYRITYGGHTITVAATKRSKWIGPLVNGSAPKVSIRAVSAAGAGRAVTASVRPTAEPASVRPVMATRLFDSRGGPRVDRAHPFRIAIPGKGTVGRSAGSVQLALSVVDPTASGTLRVTTNGVSPVPVAAIAYHRGQLATATISVPLNPSGTLIFTPSAGSMRLFGDQLGYTAAAGSTLTPVAPRVIGRVARVGTGAGTELSLAGQPGVTAATRAVVLRVQGISARPSYLKVWRSELSAAPNVLDVAVGPGRPGVNTVIVPLGASQQIRLATGVAGVRGVVTLLGTVQQSGGGRLETFPPTALADNGSRAHPALTMGVPSRLVRALGISQVPATHVGAVLVQVTVRSPGRAGRLWVWSHGHRRPTPVLAFPAGGSVTSTALVQPGRHGDLSVQSTVAGVVVSIDAIGYVTAP